MKWTRILKAEAMPKGRRINYDDDIVVVYDKSGDVIYKGMEDYEPMKREDWRWNKEKQYYTLGNDYIKVCLDI